MKQIASILMVTLCVVAAHAHEKPVRMTFSGTSANSVTNFQTASSTCSGPNKLYLTEVAGAGVFRFQDGSLLEVALTQEADCIDLTTNVAHCTLTFRITGGTGRFKEASGVLTMTETVDTVAADASNNPVFFAATGEFTGTVSGVSEEQDQDGKGE